MIVLFAEIDWGNFGQSVLWPALVAFGIVFAVIVFVKAWLVERWDRWRGREGQRRVTLSPQVTPSTVCPSWSPSEGGSGAGS